MERELNSNILKGPMQVSIDVTNRCNLRCLHCYNYSGENIYVNNELTDKELMKLVDDICELKPFNVCFCGGETLLRKDILIHLIKKLKSHEINSTIVSNGILLTESVAKELKECGIGQVQISLDGIGESHDKLRGMSGAYEKAVQALMNLKKFKVSSSIAFSPTLWNLNDFSKVVNLALDLNVLEVRLQELMPIGRASINTKEIIPSMRDYRKLKGEIITISRELKKLKKNLKLDWGDPIDHLIRFPKYPDYNYSVGIKADGKISASMYLPLSVGDIRRHSLIDYWNNGLHNIWTSNIVKKVAYNCGSVKAMSFDNCDLPTPFLEEDIYIDLIDNKQSLFY